MNMPCVLLVSFLRDPQRAASLTLSDWDLLIRQARRADLLAHIAGILQSRGLKESVPPEIQSHLAAAEVVAEAQERAVRWEVNRIGAALEERQVPIILLKGAAYLLAGLPNARGRIFYDVDILVPKTDLEQVEHGLFRHGWVVTHTDAYDQHYYRTWMHELPPLKHIRRQTIVDVHHNILPETARLNTDVSKLWEAARLLPGQQNVRVLAPEDMILHSAVHLFHDGEFEHGLRDLVDLDVLLRHFSQQPRLWSDLVSRAGQLGLQRPLHYALRYTRQVLGTPVPESVQEAAALGGAPATVVSKFMDGVLTRGLQPDHASCRSMSAGLSRWFLYVRSHYLRMPLHLLIPHLARKTIKQHFGSESTV